MNNVIKINKPVVTLIPEKTEVITKPVIQTEKSSGMSDKIGIKFPPKKFSFKGKEYLLIRGTDTVIDLETMNVSNIFCKDAERISNPFAMSLNLSRNTQNLKKKTQAKKRDVNAVIRNSLNINVLRIRKNGPCFDVIDKPLSIGANGNQIFFDEYGRELFYVGSTGANLNRVKYNATIQAQTLPDIKGPFIMSDKGEYVCYNEGATKKLLAVTVQSPYSTPRASLTFDQAYDIGDVTPILMGPVILKEEYEITKYNLVITQEEAIFIDGEAATDANLNQLKINNASSGDTLGSHIFILSPSGMSIFRTVAGGMGMNVEPVVSPLPPETFVVKTIRLNESMLGVLCDNNDETYSVKIIKLDYDTNTLSIVSSPVLNKKFEWVEFSNNYIVGNRTLLDDSLQWEMIKVTSDSVSQGPIFSDPDAINQVITENDVLILVKESKIEFYSIKNNMIFLESIFTAPKNPHNQNALYINECYNLSTMNGNEKLLAVNLSMFTETQGSLFLPCFIKYMYKDQILSKPTIVHQSIGHVFGASDVFKNFGKFSLVSAGLRFLVFKNTEVGPIPALPGLPFSYSPSTDKVIIRENIILLAKNIGLANPSIQLCEIIEDEFGDCNYGQIIPFSYNFGTNILKSIDISENGKVLVLGIASSSEAINPTVIFKRSLTGFENLNYTGNPVPANFDIMVSVSKEGSLIYTRHFDDAIFNSIIDIRDPSQIVSAFINFPGFAAGEMSIQNIKAVNDFAFIMEVRNEIANPKTSSNMLIIVHSLTEMVLRNLPYHGQNFETVQMSEDYYLYMDSGNIYRLGTGVSYSLLQTVTPLNPSRVLIGDINNEHLVDINNYQAQYPNERLYVSLLADYAQISEQLPAPPKSPFAVKSIMLNGRKITVRVHGMTNATEHQVGYFDTTNFANPVRLLNITSDHGSVLNTVHAFDIVPIKDISFGKEAFLFILKADLANTLMIVNKNTGSWNFKYVQIIPAFEYFTYVHYLKFITDTMFIIRNNDGNHMFKVILKEGEPELVLVKSLTNRLGVFNVYKDSIIFKGSNGEIIKYNMEGNEIFNNRLYLEDFSLNLNEIDQLVDGSLMETKLSNYHIFETGLRYHKLNLPVRNCVENGDYFYICFSDHVRILNKLTGEVIEKIYVDCSLILYPHEPNPDDFIHHMTDIGNYVAIANGMRIILMDGLTKHVSQINDIIYGLFTVGDRLMVKGLSSLEAFEVINYEGVLKLESTGHILFDSTLDSSRIKVVGDKVYINFQVPLPENPSGGEEGGGGM